MHNLDEKREGERRTMIAVTDLAHVAAGEEKKFRFDCRSLFTGATCSEDLGGAAAGATNDDRGMRPNERR